MKYIRPHLSPQLRAQITPTTRRDVRFTAAGVFFLLASILLIVNIWPSHAPAYTYNTADLKVTQSDPNQSLNGTKEVLGASTQAPAAAEFTQYTVKTGDTLFNISQQYNIRWDLIAQINNLSEPYVLHAGQQIKIPQTTTGLVPNKIYTIKTGETLASIAKQFNITMDDIVAVNPNLQKSDLITVGQVIKLP